MHAAGKAFEIFQELTKKPSGAPKTTWVKNLENDLDRIGTNFESVKITVLNWPLWRSVVVECVRETSLSSQSTGQRPDDDAVGKVCIAVITGVSNQDTHYHTLSAVPFPRVILCAFFSHLCWFMVD